ncbi:hypothetical protein, partial [Sporosarcina sp. P13]|uniref:hypothetical protein n=1 Tax=Sporosarcina sp. P13 TaxID=2048263 RepID=UPI001E3B8768
LVQGKTILCFVVARLTSDTEVSKGRFPIIASARGGLPPAMSQLAKVALVVSWLRLTPQLCLRLLSTESLW